MIKVKAASRLNHSRKDTSTVLTRLNFEAANLGAPSERADFIFFSGGQTGADRAALDFALSAGYAHGGWCPRTRRAEDGVIANCYQLRETPSREYLQRTEWNVRDSDGTLVFSGTAKATGGTLRTVQFARDHAKPVLVLHPGIDPVEAGAHVAEWVRLHNILRINVDGTRASKAPGIGNFTQAVLRHAFGHSPLTTTQP